MVLSLSHVVGWYYLPPKDQTFIYVVAGGLFRAKGDQTKALESAVEAWYAYPRQP